MNRKNGQVSLDTNVTKIYKNNDLWKIEFVKTKKEKPLAAIMFFYVVDQ